MRNVLLECVVKKHIGRMVVSVVGGFGVLIKFILGRNGYREKILRAKM